MDYLLIKGVHVASVVASGTLFALRGAWRFARPGARMPRAVRIVPQVVDTVLLLSALALARVWMDGGLPLGWIGAKVAVLFAYVGLGIVALRPGLPPARRAAALAASALAFAYIVGVALTKSPAGPLRWLIPLPP